MGALVEVESLIALVQFVDGSTTECCPMKDKPAKAVVPTPATYINVQSAITGLRGRDLISTLRNVGRHGLRHPFYTARHMLELGGQLGRVLLGDTLHQPLIPI